MITLARHVFVRGERAKISINVQMNEIKVSFVLVAVISQVASLC